MKKRSLIILAAATVFLSSALPRICSADVDVNIGINLPLPGFVFSAPPVLVIVPQTYVYAVPDVAIDIFFYRDYWYRPHHGYWYRSNRYNGPWDRIGSERIPGELRHLPDHRIIPPGHKRIPYGQVKKNWKEWERGKHWEKSEHRYEKNHNKYEKKQKHKEKGKGHWK